MIRRNLFFFLSVLVLVPIFLISGFSVVLVHDLVNSSVQDSIRPIQNQIAALLSEHRTAHESIYSQALSRRGLALDSSPQIWNHGKIQQINFYKSNLKLRKSFFRGANNNLETFAPPKNSEIGLDAQRAKVGYKVELDSQKLNFVYLHKHDEKGSSPGNVVYVETLSSLAVDELNQTVRKSNFIFFLADDSSEKFLTNFRSKEGPLLESDQDFKKKILFEANNFKSQRQISKPERLMTMSLLGKSYLVSQSSVQLGDQHLWLLVGASAEASQNWKTHLSYQILFFSLTLAALGLCFSWLISRIFLKNHREDFRI